MTEDVVDKIEHDHREVEELFAEFEQTHDRALAAKICDELEIHTAAEEEAVYPVMRSELADGEEEIAQAEHEHANATALIERIRHTDDDDALTDLMSQLKTEIEHHVHEEETEILPQARAELPSDELEELGDEFEAAKDEAG